MPKSFQIGDTVLDTGSGQHGIIIDSDRDSVIPGLERSNVQFDGGRIERFYWTRLQLVTPLQPTNEPERAWGTDMAVDADVSTPAEPVDTTEKPVEAPKKRTPRKTTPKAPKAVTD